MTKVGRKNDQPFDWSSLVWMLSFLALLGFFYWLDQNSGFQEFVAGRLSLWTARGTVFILSFLGLELDLAGTTVVGPALRVEIAKSCSGTFVFFMFAAAVIPFPCPWKTRLKGILAGLGTLLLINLLRTSLIVLVVSRFPGSLWTFHIIIGQAMVITAMIGVFLWWSKNAGEASLFPFLKNNRAILKALVLFLMGYVGCYAIYQVFLTSAFGLFIKKLITTHTFWILSVFRDSVSGGGFSSLREIPVNLVEGCLSSPVVVLLAAVAVAWPAPWWKRGLVILLGFIPFFYGYHLFRAVLVTLTLDLQTKNLNVVYNFYGQVFLILFLLGCFAYFTCSRQKIMPYRTYFLNLVLTTLVALPTAAALGWLTHHLMTPWLLNPISGSMVPAFNPEQVVSTMFPLQVFIWLILMGTTPNLSPARKIVLGLTGILVAFVFYAATVILFETFHMAPHKGLLKLFVISLPFAVYGGCFLFRRKSDHR